jgi:acyl-CoA thioesterase-1
MKILVGLLMLFSFSVQALPSSTKKLVIIGDSLTEGFGVRRELAFPSLLQKKIDAAKKNWRVINSGISGSTSASAPSRVTWHLKQKPELIILALGANDGLRGSSVKAMEENLNKAAELAKKAGVKIILAGIQVPPNYGSAYATSFQEVFARVAQKSDIPLIPFLLEKVAGEKSLNLDDGIHPNEKGHAVISETVFTAIQKYL